MRPILYSCLGVLVISLGVLYAVDRRMRKKPPARRLKEVA